MARDSSFSNVKARHAKQKSELLCDAAAEQNTTLGNGAFAGNSKSLSAYFVVKWLQRNWREL